MQGHGICSSNLTDSVKHFARKGKIEIFTIYFYKFDFKNSMQNLKLKKVTH